MANKIQIKRGLKANLPLLDVGEPAFTTDTKEFFIGDGISNIDFAKQSDLEITNSQVQDLSFKLAGGTASTITLSMQQLTDGYSKTFIASANNNGAATKINGKPLYKPNTTIAPNLISGKAYTVWYNQAGDCFFIKASAEGDAISANVLAGKKFSNDNDTGLVGVMTNNGTINKVLGLNETYNIPKGYTDGGQITQNIPVSNPSWGDQLESSQVTVGAYSYNVANNYAYLKVPSNTYLNNINWIFHYEPDLLAQNIVDGKNIFGVTGKATVTSLGGYSSGSYINANNIQRSINPSISVQLDTSGKVGNYNWSYANSLIVLNNYCYVVNYGFLQKFDQNGNLVWSRSLGTSSLSSVYSDIKCDNSNIIVFLTSKLFKYDQNGNLLWTVDITDPTTGKYIRYIEVDNSGNTFMAYYWYQYNTSNNAIKKINSSGQQVWDKQMQFSKITTDGTNLYVYVPNQGGTSQHISKYDTNGNPIRTSGNGGNMNGNSGLSYCNNMLYATDWWNPNSGGYWNTITKCDLNLLSSNDASGSIQYANSTTYLGCFSKDARYLYVLYSRMDYSASYIRKLRTSDLMDEWAYPIWCDKSMSTDDYNNLWIRSGNTLLKLTESYKIL